MSVKNEREWAQKKMSKRQVCVPVGFFFIGSNYGFQVAFQSVYMFREYSLFY